MNIVYKSYLCKKNNERKRNNIRNRNKEDSELRNKKT